MKVLNDWDVLSLMHTHFAKQRSSVHVPNWEKFDGFSFLHLHLIVIVACHSSLSNFFSLLFVRRLVPARHHFDELGLTVLGTDVKKL